MTDTWVAGSLVAVIAGVVGFFVVLRQEAFAAHAIPNGAFAGAAGAALVGISSLWGLAVFAVLSALGISRLSRRARSDVATALALVLMLALGAAFLSHTDQYSEAVFALLFGEILGVGTGQVLDLVGLGTACLAAVAVLYRPLLLSSALPEVAAARGLRARRMETAFLLILGLAAALTVPVVGALLIFSLMVGPPAAARSVTARPSLALGLSVAGALVTVWAATASSYWTNWPIGFFVGTYSAVLFALGRACSALEAQLGHQLPGRAP